MKPIEDLAVYRGALKFQLALVLLLASVSGAHAERAITLLNFTNTLWKFNDSGLELGSDWRMPEYDDSTWPAGYALLGVENTPEFYPFPFLTPLALGPTNNVTTNFYFRAHFTIDASNLVAGARLMSTNYVDDGCVIYLNGIEAGRIRVPTNQNAATYASASVLSNGTFLEGTAEALELPSPLLRMGDNVVAVEVHQASFNSSDVAWAMNLTSLNPILGDIVSQPQSQQVEILHPATLCVQVMGGPVTYQWQTNNGSGIFVNVIGATNACYTTNSSQRVINEYRVICSTISQSVTSDVAIVEVILDRGRGPRALSAIVLEETAATNRIEVVFDESVIVNTVHSPLNNGILTNGTFRVILWPSNIVVGVSNSIYSPGTFPGCCTLPKVTLRMNITNWFYRTNYYILLNYIRDTQTNVISPNTIIPVTWSNASQGAFTSALPPMSLTNTLAAAHLAGDRIQVSWPSNAYGWALERSTNVSGPWQGAQPMANPYTTNFSQSQFFYRLHAP